MSTATAIATAVATADNTKPDLFDTDTKSDCTPSTLKDCI